MTKGKRKTAKPSRAQRLKQRRRRGLPPLHTGPDMTIMLVVANYQQQSEGWSAELIDPAQIDEYGGPLVVRWVGVYKTPREVFDAVMIAIEEIGDEYDAAVSAMHALAGDPEAWMAIAQRDGFARLANITD